MGKRLVVNSICLKQIVAIKSKKDLFSSRRKNSSATKIVGAGTALDPTTPTYILKGIKNILLRMHSQQVMISYWSEQFRN